MIAPFSDSCLVNSMVFANDRALRSPYPAALQAILNLERAHESRTWLAPWSQISAQPTPLRAMPGLASRLGVEKLWVKDESARSPLGSFKALGAPVALMRLAMRLSPEPPMEADRLIAGHYAQRMSRLTVVSATAGNHGRALAAAARSMGCRCVIVMHEHSSVERQLAIAEQGAQLIMFGRNYDESVRHAERLARAHGWHVVSDTSYDGYEIIPRDVMQGYATIAAEIVEQASDMTHMFLQGGVGGLAAGIGSYLWERFGPLRPCLVVVEPQQAACLYQSALKGQPACASGSLDSVMAGLACGDVSPLAWRFLQSSVDTFMTITDAEAVAAMRVAAAGSAVDCPMVMGESGAAGLAGLRKLRANAAYSQQAALDSSSRVMLINTEGATAPSQYHQHVGEMAASVLARQAAWRPLEARPLATTRRSPPTPRANP